AVPFDDKSPFVTSGIRIGVPAITTRGMKEKDMESVVSLVDEVMMNIDDTKTIEVVGKKVHSLMNEFPLYPNLPAHS
ncbi:MAG: serine hydroxymethyltransferase, partial [Ferruginibacter sp.]